MGWPLQMCMKVEILAPKMSKKKKKNNLRGASPPHLAFRSIFLLFQNSSIIPEMGDPIYSSSSFHSCSQDVKMFGKFYLQWEFSILKKKINFSFMYKKIRLIYEIRPS